jgi:hypothetical protein
MRFDTVCHGMLTTDPHPMPVFLQISFFNEYVQLYVWQDQGVQDFSRTLHSRDPHHSASLQPTTAHYLPQTLHLPSESLST